MYFASLRTFLVSYLLKTKINSRRLSWNKGIKQLIQRLAFGILHSVIIFRKISFVATVIYCSGIMTFLAPCINFRIYLLIYLLTGKHVCLCTVRHGQMCLKFCAVFAVISCQAFVCSGSNCQTDWRTYFITVSQKTSPTFLAVTRESIVGFS